MRLLRLFILALFAASASVLAPEALATATVNKQFTPATVDPGDVSRLRISFFNSSQVPLTAAALTDNLPAQVAIAATVTPTMITMAAGSAIAPGGCTIIVAVTSTTPGTVTNTTSSLTTGVDITPPASAQFTVLAASPTQPIPVDSPVALALLLLMVGVMGARYARGR